MCHSFFVEAPQWVEFMRKGEYDVVVIACEETLPLLPTPTFDLDLGTLWTAAMLTGVVPYALEVTILALLGVASECRGATIGDGINRLIDVSWISPLCRKLGETPLKGVLERHASSAF